MQESLLIPLLGIICAVGMPVLFGFIVWYQTIKSRHIERMAMIERGMVPVETEGKVNRYASLRNGMVMVGLALGLFVGFLLHPLVSYNDEIQDSVVVVTTIFFSGAAFLGYFFISRKLQQREIKEDGKE